MTCLTKLTSNQAARVLIGIGGLLLAGPVGLVAGPPFTTDDPEPVEYQHWEWYVASQNFKTADGWSGTAPHFEVNYGAISAGISAIMGAEKFWQVDDLWGRRLRHQWRGG